MEGIEKEEARFKNLYDKNCKHPGRPKKKERTPSMRVSMRIKPEIVQFIERTEGKNRTEKFENLILFCMKREAVLRHLEVTYEKRLQELEKQIEQAEKQLGALNAVRR